MTTVQSYTQYIAHFNPGTASEKVRLHKESKLATQITIECGRRFTLSIDKIPEFVELLNSIAKAGT